ncbi:eukaryotic translation initiation factor eIF-1 [Fusarium sp. NRRL 25303]|nr:eukaryotic translation initiation factor eIF-1 [Fusarium sp. NRRL 25303]
MSIENLKTYGESLFATLQKSYPSGFGIHLRGSSRLSDIGLSSRTFVPAFVPDKPHVESPLISLTIATLDPFAEADEDTGETKQTQNYIHIRIQQRNGRKTLTTVQGLPKKFDQKKILKVIKKKFACNGTIVNDSEMGEVIQLQGDQRKDVQEFLIDKKEGLELDAKTIKVHGF